MLRWGERRRRCNELTEAMVPCPRIVLQQVLSRMHLAHSVHLETIFTTAGTIRTRLASRLFELDSLFFCSIPF